MTLMLINGYYGLYTPAYSRCHLLRVTFSAISPLFHVMRSLINRASARVDTQMAQEERVVGESGHNKRDGRVRKVDSCPIKN